MTYERPFILFLAVLLWGLSVAFSTSHRISGGVDSPSSIMNGSGERTITIPSKRRRETLLEAIMNGDGSNEDLGDTNDSKNDNSRQAGKLEVLKQLEAELAAQLALVRREKLAAIRSRPLTIGIVGFGRFGQFIAKTFAKYGNVVVTSRSDYTDIAQTMGAKYVALSDPEAFLRENLDVIVIAVSILSFDETIQSLAPYLQKDIERQRAKLLPPSRNNTSARLASSPSPLHGPLVVDVLSVKEHARKIMLEHLPVECDILCTHPMFGPDSGKDGWYNLNFVYEKTRIDKVLLDPKENTGNGAMHRHAKDEAFVDESGEVHSVHEHSEAHIEGMDRMERFLSIWEEEGCRMVPLSCRDHDAYAANSQFITHLVGRVLGSQGLVQTPIDTSGFQSVLKLVDSTTADSFDLFYGLYKYNQNSLETIKQLQVAMDDVVQNLQVKEAEENAGRQQVER
jgi:arogenate dehydrogenase (NADP+), plant